MDCSKRIYGAVGSSSICCTRDDPAKMSYAAPNFCMVYAQLTLKKLTLLKLEFGDFNAHGNESETCSVDLFFSFAHLQRTYLDLLLKDANMGISAPHSRSGSVTFVDLHLGS